VRISLSMIQHNPVQSRNRIKSMYIIPSTLV
jgi:hypothetical protein